MRPISSDIRDWMTLLGILTTGSMASDESEIRTIAIGSALAVQFSADTFTHESAVAVAAECRHFPTFGEIVPLLREWRRNRDHPFGVLAIEGPTVQAREAPERPIEPAPEWVAAANPRRPLRERGDDDFDPEEAAKLDKEARDSAERQLAILLGTADAHLEPVA